MERRGADDWDNRKMEQIAKAYMSLRKEIWAPLAQRTGEKWNVIEQKVTDSTTRSTRYENANMKSPQVHVQRSQEPPSC